jgi:hypothetical protein
LTITQRPARRRIAETAFGASPLTEPAPENAQTSVGELAAAQLMPLLMTQLGK